MTHRLTPFCSADACNLSKVGKSKSPLSLANRLPRDLFAKVGSEKLATPMSLAARMPSAEIAAKVGLSGIGTVASRRVIRRSARG